MDVGLTRFVRITARQKIRRNRYKLAKFKITMTRDANFYSDRIVDIWNDLPDSIVMASTVSLFKCYLRNFEFSAYIMH